MVDEGPVTLGIGLHEGVGWLRHIDELVGADEVSKCSAQGSEPRPR
jgi:hypothetical protein